ASVACCSTGGAYRCNLWTWSVSASRRDHAVRAVGVDDERGASDALYLDGEDGTRGVFRHQVRHVCLPQVPRGGVGAVVDRQGLVPVRRGRAGAAVLVEPSG